MKGYTNMKHLEPITEETGSVRVNNKSFPNITGLSYPTSQYLIDKNNSLSNYKRGRYITRNLQKEDKTENMPNEDAMIVHTYFVKIPRMKEDDMGYTEYLHATYDL